MGYIKELEDKIKDYLEGDYEIIESDKIPDPDNVSFGKKAYKINLTSFCIDLRRSTDLLTIHDKETCGKIHKAYLTIASKIILENGGQIRSFNGDSILAFWPAKYKEDISAAVQTAFQVKWALDVKFTAYFEKYSKIDFGIGIDWGTEYIVKAGLPRNDNNNDLVFLGMCVNYSCMIANQAKGPYNIEVSTFTYDNLTENWIYGNNNNIRQNMWIDGKINWKGKEWKTKCTNWYQSINE